jgi:hypothetical protein
MFQGSIVYLDAFIWLGFSAGWGFLPHFVIWVGQYIVWQGWLTDSFLLEMFWTIHTRPDWISSSANRRLYVFCSANRRTVEHLKHFSGEPVFTWRYQITGPLNYSARGWFLPNRCYLAQHTSQTSLSNHSLNDANVPDAHKKKDDIFIYFPFDGMSFGTTYTAPQSTRHFNHAVYTARIWSVLETINLYQKPSLKSK